MYFTPLVKSAGQNRNFWHAGRIEKSAARLFVFYGPAESTGSEEYIGEIPQGKPPPP